MSVVRAIESAAIVKAPLEASVASPETATGLKFVPSATIIMPDVFVPIVKSSPVIVKSPPMTVSPVNVTEPVSEKVAKVVPRS